MLWFFHLSCALSWMTQNSDHPRVYWLNSWANLGRLPDFSQINSWATGHLTWMGWVHHSWRFGHAEALHKVGPEMPEHGSKTSTVPVVWASFGIFLAWSKWFPVVIGDHGWNLVTITMTRRQSNSQWSGSIVAYPTPKYSECKNPLENLSPRFWDQDGILLIDYLPKGQTIKTEYYSSLLVQLKDNLKEKCRGKVTKGILFLHDNAPAHRALATQKKLAYLGFQCLDAPPYSPDLAPSDYHLFPGLKKLKGRHFLSDAEVIAAMETWLDGQPSVGFFFFRGFQS